MMFNILRAEYIKLKGSQFVAIMIIITLGPLFNGISVASKLREIDDKVNAVEAIYDFSIQGYTMIILPTIIILIFLINMREERINGGIKEVLTLPVTKKQVYFSKLIVGVLLVALSLFSFFIVLVGAAFLQNSIMISSVGLVMLRMIKIFLVSLGIIGIQFYLSINYESVTVPLGLGFCFLIPSFFISSSDYSILYPWGYMSTINNSVGMDLSNILMIIISIIIFCSVSILGYIKFRKTDIC